MTAPQPLTADQRQALEQAGERAKAFTGAARVAAFNGWSIGFFAAVTLLFGIFNLTAFVLDPALPPIAELPDRLRHSPHIHGSICQWLTRVQ